MYPEPNIKNLAVKISKKKINLEGLHRIIYILEYTLTIKARVYRPSFFFLPFRPCMASLLCYRSAYDFMQTLVCLLLLG